MPGGSDDTEQTQATNAAYPGRGATAGSRDATMLTSRGLDLDSIETGLPQAEPMTPDEEDAALARLCLRRGFCTREELDEAEESQRQTLQRLGPILIKRGMLAQRQYNRLMEELREDRTRQRLPGFVLLSKIGKGASATVLKATQVNLDRLVAIKVLPRRAFKNETLVEKFRAEARAAAKLNHPHIVQVFDVGQAGEAHYIVMEFVPGPTVHDEIARRKRFEESDALDVTIAMASALEHAHAKGIVHRDVKPKNIIIAESDGSPKLADLGLAREIADEEAGLAEKGRTFGTPYYISPEQIRGDVHIGPPSDIYSLGATLFYMLTGRVPFPGTDADEVMDRHMSDPLEPPSSLVPTISPGVSEVVEKMMAKSVDKRYTDCSELLMELRAWRAFHTLKKGEETKGARGKR
ncbi:MAG: serine/threonine-protein kinase [Phycisphaerales bacterium]